MPRNRVLGPKEFMFRSFGPEGHKLRLDRFDVLAIAVAARVADLVAVLDFSFDVIEHAPGIAKAEAQPRAADEGDHVGGLCVCQPQTTKRSIRAA